MYSRPQQSRAQATEQRFLDAMDHLLVIKSITKLTIDEIADQAQLSRGAFLKRFGSKKQALILLFRRHCDECNEVMRDIVRGLGNDGQSLLGACTHASTSFELLLIKHFSSNRAMYELYLEDLEVHELTKGIFLNAVNMMREIQKTYLSGTASSDVGAFAAAQLMVTINYNVVMKAMPAMPIERQVRQPLIGKIIADALAI